MNQSYIKYGQYTKTDLDFIYCLAKSLKKLNTLY